MIMIRIVYGKQLKSCPQILLRVLHHQVGNEETVMRIEPTSFRSGLILSPRRYHLTMLAIEKIPLN